jgi:hypothetical protein
MFSWRYGFASGGRLSGPAASFVKLAVGVVLVLVMSLSIGPAISAAQGHGTRGYFVAQTENCGRHSCTWRGQFRLPDGQVTRGGVSFDGSYPSMHAGSMVPALDTGDFSNVFPRHGSVSWLVDLAAGVFGIALIGQVTWAWAKRRQGTLRATAGANTPTASSPTPNVLP